MVSSTCCKTARKLEKDFLLVSAKQGPQRIEIMLFDWPHLLTTPSIVLYIHVAFIVHAPCSI